MLELAPYSRYYRGYDNRQGNIMQGRTYTRAPSEDDTTYADAPATHIRMRADVVIVSNDADGAVVEWAADQGCPFTYKEEG